MAEWRDVVVASKVACSSRIRTLEDANRRNEEEIKHLMRRVHAHDCVLSEYQQRFPAMHIPADFARGISSPGEIECFREKAKLIMARRRQLQGST